MLCYLVMKLRERGHVHYDIIVVWVTPFLVRAHSGPPASLNMRHDSEVVASYYIVFEVTCIKVLVMRLYWNGQN